MNIKFLLALALVGLFITTNLVTSDVVLAQDTASEEGGEKKKKAEEEEPDC